MRAVVDTNVLLSGLLWRGSPHTLIAVVRTGVLTLISSPALITEFSKVITRTKFRTILARTNANPEQVMAELGRLTEIVDPLPLPAPFSRDPGDDAVLAAAPRLSRILSFPAMQIFLFSARMQEPQSLLLLRRSPSFRQL